MKKKTLVTGGYSHNGYDVWMDGQIVYSATNHRQDSQQAAYREEDRLTLREIRTMCIRTCQEIADEKQATFGGVERVPENS